MNPRDAQQQFFEELKSKISKKVSLAETLSDFLSVSIDSAYRRISGKTALSFEEAIKLAERFDIDWNSFIEKNRGTVTFERRSTLKSQNDLAIHLKEMAEMMKMQVTDTSEPMIYSTKDIPIFYHFFFPELGAFKLFTWHRALNTAKDLNERFDAEKTIADYGNLFKEISEYYARIPAIEIWSEVAVFGFIRQLKYYYDSGLMGDKDMALLICEQHKSIFEHVKEQARLGQKLSISRPDINTGVQYDLYFNELFVMDNSALSTINGQRVFFNSFAYFNYIPTSDKQFCADIENWLTNQMKRSVKLSQTREKERNLYFRNINKEIDQLIDYIKEN